MNYGSTLRLKLTNSQGDKVFYDHYLVLSKWNMDKTIEQAFREFQDNAWQEIREILGQLEALDRLTTLKITDDELLKLARQRGLIPGPTTVDLFYVPSQSGKTHGHYIELNKAGEVTCTCPGFVNRGTCWASKGVQTNKYKFDNRRWMGTPARFYVARKEDYPDYSFIAV